MTPDHSLTYKELKLRNLGHILRKRALEKLIRKIPKNPSAYADFGCSNGYLTDHFKGILEPALSFGFDHSSNLAHAQKKFRDIEFVYIDLNKVNAFEIKFQALTCFETLEHVGDLRSAIKNLRAASLEESVVLITVPIEIGFIGIVKYIIKRFIFRYEFPIKCTDFNYFLALLFGRDISKYREPASGYGSHFGFDYRVVDRELKEEFYSQKIEVWNSFATRFYRISSFSDFCTSE